ncbi:hypothetical protein ACEWY4_016936 [Coilia grayii]|uniref:CS domain-containing protein n=1 Tax=Coilia grayii TaxID=363190 RepID=A0ABD1JLT2_9TELE
MACERTFPDTFIDEDPQKALEELNGALEESSDNAEWLCQRAYAHILLKNYSRAVDDAKKAQQLQPGLALAFLRTGIAEYHLNNCSSAHEAFLEGQKLDGSNDAFQTWIERCVELLQQETQNEATNTHAAATPPVKRDWYQTESQVIVTIMLKNAKNEDVNVRFQENECWASLKLASGEDYCLKLCLLHPVLPEQCSYRILSTKRSLLSTPTPNAVSRREACSVPQHDLTERSLLITPTPSHRAKTTEYPDTISQSEACRLPPYDLSERSLLSTPT